MFLIKTKDNVETRKIKISILVFIWSSLLFFFNLEYNLAGSNDYLIFWFSTLCIFGVILYQIFCLKYTSGFVLFEIFLVFLFLHLVYQIGYYGLRGSDSYVDYTFLKTILKDHNFVLGQYVDGWPMIHIFSSIVHFFTKIDPLLIAKFLPSFISSIIVLPIYLFVYKIYKNKQISLFTCLIYGTVHQFISMESLFVRETFALFFMIFFFYTVYTSKQKNEKSFIFLSFLLVPVIVFSHHFTSFLILMVIAIYIIVSKIIPYFFFKNENNKISLSGNINLIPFFILSFISIIGYWIYHSVDMVKKFTDIFYEAIGTKQFESYAVATNLGSPIVTLRGNIIYYSFYFFIILFSLILLIKFIKEKNNQKIEDVSFTVFFYFCIFYSFLSLYVLGSLIFPDRFFTFLWMFGLIPLTSYILILKKNVFKKILVILLISLIIFNIYNIDPSYSSGDPYQNDGIPGEKGYTIAMTIKFPPTYYGYLGAVSAIFDIQGIPPQYYGSYVNASSTLNATGQRTGARSLNSLKNFHNSSDLAVISEKLFLKDIETVKEKSKVVYLHIIEILSYKNNKNINKICDLGDINVLRGCG
jgi:hypothetical protein